MTGHNGTELQTDIDAQYAKDCEDCRAEIGATVKRLMMERRMPLPAVASGLANCLGSSVAMVQPQSTRDDFLESTIHCVREAVAGTLDAFAQAARR